MFKLIRECFELSCSMPLLPQDSSCSSAETNNIYKVIPYLSILYIKQLMFAIWTVLETHVDIFGCAREVQQISSEGPFGKAVSRRVSSPAKLTLLFNRVYWGSCTQQLWLQLVRFLHMSLLRDETHGMLITHKLHGHCRLTVSTPVIHAHTHIGLERLLVLLIHMMKIADSIRLL